MATWVRWRPAADPRLLFGGDVRDVCGHGRPDVFRRRAHAAGKALVQIEQRLDEVAEGRRLASRLRLAPGDLTVLRPRGELPGKRQAHVEAAATASAFPGKKRGAAPRGAVGGGVEAVVVHVVLLDSSLPYKYRIHLFMRRVKKKEAKRRKKMARKWLDSGNARRYSGVEGDLGPGAARPSSRTFSSVTPPRADSMGIKTTIILDDDAAAGAEALQAAAGLKTSRNAAINLALRMVGAWLRRRDAGCRLVSHAPDGSTEALDMPLVAPAWIDAEPAARPAESPADMVRSLTSPDDPVHQMSDADALEAGRYWLAEGEVAEDSKAAEVIREALALAQEEGSA